jgi:hypothetical protein
MKRITELEEQRLPGSWGRSVVGLNKELAEIARILSQKPDAAVVFVSTAQAIATVQ